MSLSYLRTYWFGGGTGVLKSGGGGGCCTEIKIIKFLMN